MLDSVDRWMAESAMREHTDQLRRYADAIERGATVGHSQISPARTVGRRKTTAVRDRAIGEIIASGLKGSAYYKALDAKKIKPPEAWIRSGTCANTYLAAARDKKWAHLINSEKSRIARRLRESSGLRETSET
jgi:hypothetical protein